MKNKKLFSIIILCVLLSLCFILAQTYMVEEPIPNVQDDINYYLGKDNYNQQELQNIENYLLNTQSENINDQDLELGKKYLSQIKEQINSNGNTGEITKKYLVALSKKEAGMITNAEDFGIAEKYYTAMLGKPVEIKGSFAVNEDYSISVGGSTIFKAQLDNLALRQDVIKIIIDADGKLNFESETENYLADNANIEFLKEKGSYLFFGRDNNPAVVTVGEHIYTGDEVFITENTIQIINKNREITNTFNFKGQDFTATSNPLEESKIFINKKDDSMQFTNTQFSSVDGKLRNYEIFEGKPKGMMGSTYHDIKFGNDDSVIARLSASDGFTDPVIYYDGNMVINQDDKIKVVFSETNWPVDDKMVLINPKTNEMTYDNVRLKLKSKTGYDITSLGGKATFTFENNQLSVGSLAGLAKGIITPPGPDDHPITLYGTELKLLNTREPPQSRIRREYFLEDITGGNWEIRVGGQFPGIQVQFPDGQTHNIYYPEDEENYFEILNELGRLTPSLPSR